MQGPKILDHDSKVIMKEVLYCLKFGGGFLAKCITETGAKADVHLWEIRGATVKPTEGQPGYYLFCGMEKQQNMYGKHPLLFLCEGIAPTQAELFKKIRDDGARMKATIIYADMARDRKQAQGFYRDLFHKLMNEQSHMDVRPAPSVKDYEYGDALIREWVKEDGIHRPYDKAATILFNQIHNDMSAISDVKENKWYAWHALRFLLGGIVKDPVIAPSIDTTFTLGDEIIDPGVMNRGKSAGGWT